jgi:hypothetical protein
MHSAINQALESVKIMQALMRRLLNDQPGPQGDALLKARIASELNEIMVNLMDIKEILHETE